MELENIATPPTKQSPELRYASLHRAVEQGIASGEVWLELAEVCMQLGHCEEAVRAWKTMPDGSARNRLESLLARRQLIQPTDPQGPGRKPVVQQVAPPLEEPESINLAEHVSDSMQYLFTGRMLLLVLVATLAFPVIVGLGGFLTAGSSMLVLAAMAALPGLCVLGIVGALGRRILVSSSRGEEEVPALPGLAGLSHAAMRFLGDASLEVVTLVVPSVVLLWLQAPLTTCLPTMLLGALLLPMAHALRQVRDDFRAYAPGVLLRAIGRTLIPYLGISCAFWAMFLPAAVVAYATLGNPIWLQLSVVGPLTVLPIFVTSRMLGTFLDVHRHRLGDLLGAATAPAKESAPASARPSMVGKKVRTNLNKAPASTAPKAPAHARQATSRPQPSPHHPAASVQGARPAKVAPPTKGLAGYVAQAKAAESPAAGKSTRTAARPAGQPAASQPASQPVAKSAAARPAEPAARPAAPAAKPAARPTTSVAAPKPALANAVSPTSMVIGDPVPSLDEELAQIPGATVVRGADRQRLGASALKHD